MVCHFGTCPVLHKHVCKNRERKCPLPRDHEVVYEKGCKGERNLESVKDKVASWLANSVATTLAARIRLDGESVHGLLYDKPVALTDPIW